MPTPMTRVPLAAALLLAATALGAAEPPPPPDRPQVNQAQQLVFTNDLMRQVPAGGVLEYRFTRRGKAVPDYEDRVKVTVTRVAADGRRDLEFDFLSEDYHVDFHPAAAYRGNPVPIHFLERDIKEMSAATEGDIAYFRNRIRRAFNQPQIKPVFITLDDREVDGIQVTVMPYADDPNIGKYKDYVNKRYDFLFSEQIPGGLYQIRTSVPAPDSDRPLLEEQLTFDHATPAG